mmetsp:Transcript_21288/g.82639  ORF Transcript_21288/g.82639 Transcript_21288/m.82639 type:complete len:242 (-) Transcript_21288:46-771(-)
MSASSNWSLSSSRVSVGPSTSSHASSSFCSSSPLHANWSPPPPSSSSSSSSLATPSASTELPRCSSKYWSSHSSLAQSVASGTNVSTSPSSTATSTSASLSSPSVAWRVARMPRVSTRSWASALASNARTAPRRASSSRKASCFNTARCSIASAPIFHSLASSSSSSVRPGSARGIGGGSRAISSSSPFPSVSVGVVLSLSCEEEGPRGLGAAKGLGSPGAGNGRAHVGTTMTSTSSLMGG